MEGLPWSGVCVFFLGVQTLIDKRINKKALFLDIIVIVGVFFLFNFNNFLIFIKMFFHLNSKHAGWDMPLGTLFELISDYRIKEFIPHNLFQILSILFNSLMLVIFVKILKRTGLNSYLSIVLIGNLILYIFIYTLYHDQPAGGYKIWKAFISFSPVAFILLLCFSYRYLSNNILLKEKSARKRLFFGVICICILSGVIINTSYIFVQPFYGVTDKNHLELREFAKKENRNTDYIIDVNSLSDYLFSTVILPIGRTHVLRSMYNQHPDNFLQFKTNDIFIADSIVPSIYTPKGETIFQNKRFTLIRLKTDSILLIGSNGLSESVHKYNDEASFITAQSVISDTVNLKFISNSSKTENFNFTLQNLSNSKNNFEIFVNSIKIASYETSESTRIYQIDNLSIINGLNDISIVFDKVPDNCLLRNLYFTEFPHFITYDSPFQYNEKRQKFVQLAKHIYFAVNLFRNNTIDIKFSHHNLSQMFFLLDGWHGQENGFRWTDKKAGISFYSDNQYPIRLILYAQTYSYSGDTKIIVNGKIIDTIRPEGRCEIMIPETALSETGQQELIFENKNAISPALVNKSGDTRLLGLSVERITLQHINKMENISYKLGTPINFSNKKNNTREYFVSGLSSPEGNFTWSDGRKSIFQANIKLKHQKNLKLDIKFYMVLQSNEGYQTFRLYANDYFIEEKIVYPDDRNISFIIPQNILTQDGILNLRFEYPNATSPKSLGMNTDERLLAFAFSKMKILRSSKK
jgi:hypothetical protein